MSKPKHAKELKSRGLPSGARGVADRYAKGVIRGFGAEFENIGRGVVRTARGFDPTEAVTISAENERAALLIFDALVVSKTPIGPIYKIIEKISSYISDAIYSGLSKRQKKAFFNKILEAYAGKVGKKHGIALAKRAIKNATRKIAENIAQRAANSQIMKKIAKTLSIQLSKTARASRIPFAGTLYFLLSTQGIIEKASEARKRLLFVSPKLHKILVNKNLDMLFFTVEPFVPTIISDIIDLYKDGGVVNAISLTAEVSGLMRGQK